MTTPAPPTLATLRRVAELEDQAHALLLQAADLEREAYEALGPGRPRTRAILAVSVASKLWKAGRPGALSEWLARVDAELGDGWAHDEIDRMVRDSATLRREDWRAWLVET